MSEKQFEGQRDDESVQFIFRRHVVTTRKGLLFFIIISILGFLPLLIWHKQEFFWIFLACVAVGILKMLYEHMLWHFSVYVVTNQRIRQISQRGLFKKTVVDLGLDKIQTISYHVPGWTSGLFNYGTILIQTQVGDMTISTVSHPAKIYDKLQNVMGEYNG